MSVAYPMWCVVCRDCGCVGTRWEKPGTRADYIEYCPSCGHSHATHLEVKNKEQHDAVMDGVIDYDDMLEKNTFNGYDL